MASAAQGGKPLEKTLPPVGLGLPHACLADTNAIVLELPATDGGTEIRIARGFKWEHGFWKEEKTLDLTIPEAKGTPASAVSIQMLGAGRIEERFYIAAPPLTDLVPNLSGRIGDRVFGTSGCDASDRGGFQIHRFVNGGSSSVVDLQELTASFEFTCKGEPFKGCLHFSAPKPKHTLAELKGPRLSDATQRPDCSGMDCKALCDKGTASACVEYGRSLLGTALASPSAPQAKEAFERACSLGSFYGCALVTTADAAVPLPPQLASNCASDAAPDWNACWGDCFMNDAVCERGCKQGLRGACLAVATSKTRDEPPNCDEAESLVGRLCADPSMTAVCNRAAFRFKCRDGKPGKYCPNVCASVCTTPGMSQCPNNQDDAERAACGGVSCSEAWSKAGEAGDEAAERRYGRLACKFGNANVCRSMQEDAEADAYVAGLERETAANQREQLAGLAQWQKKRSSDQAAFDAQQRAIISGKSLTQQGAVNPAAEANPQDVRGVQGDAAKKSAAKDAVAPGSGQRVDPTGAQGGAYQPERRTCDVRMEPLTGGGNPCDTCNRNKAWHNSRCHRQVDAEAGYPCVSVVPGDGDRHDRCNQNFPTGLEMCPMCPKGAGKAL